MINLTIPAWLPLAVLTIGILNSFAAVQIAGNCIKFSHAFFAAVIFTSTPPATSVPHFTIHCPSIVPLRAVAVICFEFYRIIQTHQTAMAFIMPPGCNVSPPVWVL